MRFAGRQTLRSMFERASMDFEKTLEDLHACLPEDLRLALLRRHWQFFREEIGGAFAGLECPLDLLPDREAARASMRRFDQAFAEWQLTRSPAQAPSLTRSPNSTRTTINTGQPKACRDTKSWPTCQAS